MSARLPAGRRTIQVSSPDKVLFARAGVTKLELARYYAGVARVMVPHIRDRPVTMYSCPQGVESQCHFTKEAPRHFPAWIRRATVAKRGGQVNHVLANDAAALAYLAGQNVITPHVWLSRVDRIALPDRLIFDLDPPGERFADVRGAARELGALLRELGLVPFAMTTGSRGLHVVVPLRRTAEFDDVRGFARQVARRAVEQDPKRLTIEQRKEKRGERIFVDVLRNAYGQHAVAPYAVRPLSDAPVATPLRWEELDDRRLGPRRYTVRNLGDRLAAEGDVWAGMARSARSVSARLSADAP
jgi:bifunctional non-homologous end joining protein LigD